MRSSIAARLAREIGGFMSTRPAKLSWPGGVVSFTFDDFPRSAWLEGGAVLAKHDVRGTYYTALGLAGGENHLGPMFELDDLRALRRAGHEVACHTHSHRDCRRAAPAEIVAETEANAAAFSQLFGGATMTNFAYPFGALSLAAKAALSDRFVSCRSTGQGVNFGSVDMTDLLGLRIYDGSFDRDQLCRLIDNAAAAGGWLIFYTHDVRAAPSDFGCTPAQLDSVVAHAAATAPVLPVREALSGLGFYGEAPPARSRAA